MIAGAALALVLTAHQLAALNIAYNEGQKYGIPIYTQAIILTESSACVHRRGDDNKSLGCGQVQLSTARKTCHCTINPRVLEKDNRRNIKITAHFISDCFIRFWPDRDRALLCYNVGPFKAETFTPSKVKHSKYVARVLYWVRRLHEIRTDND